MIIFRFLNTRIFSPFQYSAFLFASLAMLSLGIVWHCDGFEFRLVDLHVTFGGKLVTAVKLWLPIIFGKCRCLFCAGVTLLHGSSQNSIIESYKMCCFPKQNLLFSMLVGLICRIALSLVSIAVCICIRCGNSQ